jgi:alkaline phosphatase D
MTNVTRRGLLGAAATGTLSLAACATPASMTGPSGYAGEVEFLHGVASGDPLTDRVILWTRVTPKSGEGAIPVKYEVFGQDDALVTSGMLSADAAHDFCVKADAKGPEACHHLHLQIHRPD